MEQGAPLQEVAQLVPTLSGKPAFPDYVDNTARSDFVLCPRKWFYSFLFSLSPAAPSIHLHAGGAFARGLEVARRAFWEKNASIAEAKRDGLEALIQFYGPFLAPPTKSGDKSLENVIRAFDSYMTRYPLDTDPIKPLRTETGRYMIEFTFSLPTEVLCPSCKHCGFNDNSEKREICLECRANLEPILYQGRSDMIGSIADTVFVTDEKTTSQLGEQWSNNWILDSQFTGYIHAARTYGYNVGGALVRGVGLLKTKITHAEAQIYRSSWEVERWWKQLQRDLRRMVRSYAEWEFDLALAKHACNAFGGCPFLILDNSQEPERWMNQYRLRRWNPLAPDFGEKLLENPALTQTPDDTVVIDLKELM